MEAAPKGTCSCVIKYCVCKGECVERAYVLIATRERYRMDNTAAPDEPNYCPSCGLGAMFRASNASKAVVGVLIPPARKHDAPPDRSIWVLA